MKRNILLAVLLTVSLAATPGAVVAQSDSTDDGIISADADLSAAEVAIATVQGVLDRATGNLAAGVALVTGDTPTADDEAQSLVDEVTTHRTAYRDHLNGLANEYDATVGNGSYVLELTIDDGDATETVFVRATGNGTDVTAVNASRTKGSWTVDRTHTLSATEAADLNDDLDEYRTEYVETGEYPEPDYFVRKGSRYGNVTELVTS